MIDGIIDDKTQKFWNHFATDDTFINYQDRSEQRKGIGLIGEDLTTYLKLCENEYITNHKIDNEHIPDVKANSDFGERPSVYLDRIDLLYQETILKSQKMKEMVRSVDERFWSIIFKHEVKSLVDLLKQSNRMIVGDSSKSLMYITNLVKASKMQEQMLIEKL